MDTSTENQIDVLCDDMLYEILFFCDIVESFNFFLHADGSFVYLIMKI